MRYKNVIEHGQFIMGPEVFELEKKMARYVNVREAISCASGTDALLMALMAVGIGHGDFVACPSFSFVATVEVIHRVGATPVFVDIGRDYNMDVTKLKAVSEVIDLSAIIAVDLFGKPADWKNIRELEIFCIEDACQSFGSIGEHRGDVICTSFYPSKPLGCWGDGGMVFTDVQSIAHTIRSIREHGKGIDQYHIDRHGINSRLDSIQAAVLLDKLDEFEDHLVWRKYIAKQYQKVFGYWAEGSSWACYPILVEDQKAVAEIDGVRVYYPVPLKPMPNSSHVSKHIACLPISDGYRRIIEEVKKVCGK